MDEREALRASCHEDIAELRKDPLVPERVFRLLERLVARLDRLEIGQFVDQDDIPTRPSSPAARRMTPPPGSLQSVRGLAERVDRELSKGKDPPK